MPCRIISGISSSESETRKKPRHRKMFAKKPTIPTNPKSVRQKQRGKAKAPKKTTVVVADVRLLHLFIFTMERRVSSVECRHRRCWRRVLWPTATVSFVGWRKAEAAKFRAKRDENRRCGKKENGKTENNRS